MPTVVGLDIGTHAVRAVELALGRGDPGLRRFGQVALPVGAVVAGEVVDPPTVASAIRRLWREGGFKAKSVVTGVSNPRVVARTVDVPAMPEDELRSALRFQVQDLIPIPVDEAILDYQVVEHARGEEGQDLLRLLLVAAHQDMVRSLIAAVDGANLRIDRIDLEPFALIRALHHGVPDLGRPGARAAEGEEPAGDGEAPGAGPEARPPAEAIVGVGAGVTNVIIHEGGVPRFVRTLTMAGLSITEAIASELEIELDDAEDLKRRADPLSGDEQQARAAQIVAANLAPIINEIRGSLDFYLAQADDGGISRVVLTGGGSRVAGLQDQLAAALDVPVERARPLEGIQVKPAGMDEQVVRDAEDLLAVAIGYGFTAEPLPGKERRITLLPAELVSRRVEQRRAVMAGAGVAALAALLVAVWLGRQGAVADEQRRAEAAEAETTRLRQEIAQLADVEGLEAELARRRQTMVAVVEDEVAWPRLLQEIAAVMPNDVWLTSFNGSRGDPGTISVSGMGFDHTSSARWLLRINELESIAGLWLPSSAVSAGPAGQQLVTFSSNANLTEAARSDRAEQLAEDG